MAHFVEKGQEALRRRILGPGLGAFPDPWEDLKIRSFRFRVKGLGYKPYNHYLISHMVPRDLIFRSLWGSGFLDLGLFSGPLPPGADMDPPITRVFKGFRA